MATIASAQPGEKAERVRRGGFRLPLAAISYLQALPLFLILGFFFLLPIAMIAVVSCLGLRLCGALSRLPSTMNYTETLGSWVTWKIYLNTLKFTVIVWALTLLIGFSGRLFPGFPYPQDLDADDPLPCLHRPLHDVEHHPHDLVDSGARPQWARQYDAD